MKNQIDNNILQYIENYRYDDENTWHSWIPTNFNSLEFDFIANDAVFDYQKKFIIKNYDKKSIFYINTKPQLSDKMGLYPHELFRLLPGQMIPVSYITLEYNNDYTGEVGIIFLNKAQYNKIQTIHATYLAESKKYAYLNYIDKKDDLKKYELELRKLIKLYSNKARDSLTDKGFASNEYPTLCLKGSFTITRNGLIDIRTIILHALTIDDSNSKIKNINSNIEISLISKNTIVHEIKHGFDISAQALYTVIKRLFHSDNHHDAKIDDIIFVQKNDYDPMTTMHSLGKRLKKIEISIRSHISENPQKEASFAQGIASYSKTFAYENIKPQSECCKQINIHENILSSIVATASRSTKFLTCKEIISKIYPVAIGWTLSFFILFSSLVGKKISDVSQSPDNNLTHTFITQFNEVSDDVIKIFIITLTIILLGYPIFKCIPRIIKNKFGYDRFNTIKNQMYLSLIYSIILLPIILGGIYTIIHIPIWFNTESLFNELFISIKKYIHFLYFSLIPPFPTA